MKNPFKKNEPVADIGATVPAGGAGYGVTVPADGAGYGVTVPAGGAGVTIPVDSIPNSGIEPEWRNANFSANDVTRATQPEGGNSYPKTEPAGQPGVQDYEATTPMSFVGATMIYTDSHYTDSQQMQTVPVFRPVVGWLVCVSGSNKGSDYRVYNGYNYIGRAQSMDICIPGDSHISNENAAVIGYDDVERVFYVGSVTGHNTVRLNGKMVLGQTLLNAYDKVKLGETTLTFIPLCGEKFDWNGR